MQDITISTTLTKKDYRKTVYFNVFLKKRWKAILFGLVFVFVVAQLVLHAAGVWVLGQRDLVLRLLLVGIYGLLLAVTEYMVYQFASTDSISLNKPHEYTFNDKGIFAQSPHGQMTYPWSSVHRVYDTKRYVLLFVNVQQCIILPKEAFSATQLEGFRQLLGKQVPAKCIVRR